MPSFLKDLNIRRRSRISLRTGGEDNNTSSENSSSLGEEQRQRNKSTSTLSSWLDRRPSPPTPLSPANGQSTTTLQSTNGLPSKTPPPVPQRPRLASSQSSRFSMIGMPVQSGERAVQATSAYAPRVLSVSDGSWVHQKVLLIFGQCADPDKPIDGQLTVCHHQDGFPPTNWPVNDCHFKALVYLQPGPNRLRLDFTSPKLPTPGTAGPAHSSWININYLPLNSAPPLQLCILVAHDSPLTYDSVPDRIAREGNDLSTAIRKFRMAAYLWQAFTAEQMNRNGFGRRCYRYEEEWQPGTLTWKDMETKQMRNEAKIHVIRLKESVAQIRDLEIAQQYEPAQRKGDLFDIAGTAVKEYFRPAEGTTQYVSCMFLDTKWDKQVGTVRGHAALGGGGDDIKLAIFGSHLLQSYPAHIEEVVPAFSDCTRTDTDFVANDCGESGSSWEAANIGIGAHLHETGHLLGCPHQESGVMLRDYVTLHRTFLTREAYSTRTRDSGLKLILQRDECAWHRLDTLRFRFHPCFRLTTDPAPPADASIQVWPVDNANVLVTAASGVAWVEITPEGDDVCHHWIEFLDPGYSSGSISPGGSIHPAMTNGGGGGSGTPPSSVPGPRQIVLTEAQLRERLPQEKRKARLAVKVFSCGGADLEIADFAALLDKSARVKLPSGRFAFRSAVLGAPLVPAGRGQDVLLPTAAGTGGSPTRLKGKLLTSLRIYHGGSLDGLEFCFEDGSTALFGGRGGVPGGSEFVLDTRRGEMLLGFHVRAGAWIDGLQVLTTTGRRSELFGNKTGGSGHTLIPPRGYSIAGVYGASGDWVNSFGLIIAR